MPPKKPAADSVDLPEPSSDDAPVEKKVEKKSDSATLRKIAAHPSTAIMVKEALKELDSRKGVSSQAIQNYIKQKYPSVDVLKLKHLARRALKKGIETGTLVRPANSSVTTGAVGRFRLAPEVKQTKPKTENVNPNVQKVTKAEKDAAKDGAKKTKKTGATKKKESENEPMSSEDSKSPKNSKRDEKAATSKVAPAKKPKAKKAATEDGKGASESAKTKGKTTKEAKAGKASQGKSAKAAGEAPVSKATGKRGKKTAE
ncbi:protein B4 [Scomber scombrus]|uniref:Protein B4 n=1 Tax=Scomber scombrus TaxID=13677 RepID=A0AAV1NAE6_SCOSC